MFRQIFQLITFFTTDNTMINRMERLKVLVWKNEYSIGVELIDAQHKHLFEIGSSAYELLKSDLSINKYDKILQIIEDLRQYTKFHFLTEEEYMLKIGYPNFLDQKMEHDAFLKKIDFVILNNIDKNQEKYLEDILSFIFDWILNHILQKDKLISQK